MKSDNDTLKRLKHKARKWWTSTNLNGVLVLCNLIMLVIIGLQTCAVQKQSETALKQTEAIIRQANSADSQVVISRRAILSQSSAADSQLHNSNTQLSMSRESMERQLRAYVYINGDTGNHTHDYVSRLKVMNVGLTPAFKVTYWWNNAVKKLNTKSGFDTTPLRISSPVFPNEARFINVSHNFTNEEMLQISMGNKAFFIWGAIYYQDVFGISRHCKFRFRIRGTANPYGFEPCEEGNDID